MKYFTVVAVLFLLIGCAGWYIHYQKTPQKINPYEEYQLTLQSPDPIAQIALIIKNIQAIKTLRNWELVGFTYHNKIAQVVLHTNQRNAIDLIKKTQQLGMNANNTPEGTIVSFPVEMPGRTIPDTIPDIRQTLKILSDKIPPESLVLGNIIANPVFRYADIKINFNNIPLEWLGHIGSSLNNLPVSLLSISANAKDNLLTGDIQLRVLGK